MISLADILDCMFDFKLFF